MTVKILNLEARATQRIYQLLGMKMTWDFNNESFTIKGISINMADLKSLEDDKWSELVAKKESEIKLLTC